MRKYETIVIFSPELNKSQLTAQISKVKEVLSNESVADVFVEEWGKRKIAYKLNKQTSGHYVCFYYETNNRKAVDELNYNLRINDVVLKFQTHFVSDKPEKYRGNMVFVDLAKTNEMIAPDIDDDLSMADADFND
ncbi:MAG: 30S ribosomal protein S6 [Bdellovibrionota bacterium]